MSKGSIGMVCSSPGFGGLELNLLKTAQWLQQQGWTVRLLLSGLSEAGRVAKDYCRDVTLLQTLTPGRHKLSVASLKTWQQQGKTDILFTVYNKDISPVSRYKRFFNKTIRFIYQQHMKVGVSKKSIVHRLRYRMIDQWIAPLPYLKDETISRTTIPARKIVVIPIPLDTVALAHGSLSSVAALQELQLPQGKIVIGVLGRIDPKKGQDFLIHCMAALEKQYPGRYHLLIMGNTTAHEGNDYAQRLQQLVAQLQLEDVVSFRPYRKDPAVFYNAIDVFAMPSHGETYGMVTLEAMFFSKPIIGINTDGTKALLEEGRLGWLIEMDDVTAFIKSLSSCLQDISKPALARQQVLAHYTFPEAMPVLEAALMQRL